MFKTAFGGCLGIEVICISTSGCFLGDKLVSNFLFDCDYGESPKLPSPWLLRNKILIKNKKLIAEPSAGLSVERTRSDGNLIRR